MAHFYARMNGNGNIVTRCGTAGSGLWAHLSGWCVGVEVRVHVNAKGEDEVVVFKTNGSRDKSSAVIVGSWTAKDVEEKAVQKKPTILSRILPKLPPRVVEAV